MEYVWLKTIALVSLNWQTFLGCIQKEWVKCCLIEPSGICVPQEIPSVLITLVLKDWIKLSWTRISTSETMSKIFLSLDSSNSGIIFSSCNNLINQIIIRLVKAQKSWPSFHIYIHTGSTPQEDKHSACTVQMTDYWQKQKLCWMYLVNEKWWQHFSHEIAILHSMLSCLGLLITPIRGLFGRHRNCLSAHASRNPSQRNQSTGWGRKVGSNCEGSV